MLVKNENEKNEIISNILKEKSLEFKYERLNLCFFKRNYYKCTLKQFNYLVYLIEGVHEYELNNKQKNFIKKMSSNEISKLISIFKELEIEYIKPKVTISAFKVEGSIYKDIDKKDLYVSIS